MKKMINIILNVTTRDITQLQNFKHKDIKIVHKDCTIWERTRDQQCIRANRQKHTIKRQRVLTNETKKLSMDLLTHVTRTQWHLYANVLTTQILKSVENELQRDLTLACQLASIEL